MDTDKILTVSIAAYNVEDYIERALDSCLIESLDALDVIVVDDGSHDRTSEIAERYAQRYPGSIRVLRKENGGYGTTVNEACRLARGRYLKLLDGDDWFDKDDLDGLIAALRDTRCDLVITNRRISRGGAEPVRDTFVPSRLNGVTIAPDDLDLFLGHWHITVSTALLESFPPDLPSHTLYTDQLFTLNAMAHSHSIHVLPELAPYCYMVGRDGQSVTRESRIAHVDDLLAVTTLGESRYLAFADEGHPDRGLMLRLLYYRLNLLRTFLLCRPSKEIRRKFKEADLSIREGHPAYYELIGATSKRFRAIRLFGYLGYWPVSLFRVENWA